MGEGEVVNMGYDSECLHKNTLGGDVVLTTFLRSCPETSSEGTESYSTSLLVPFNMVMLHF